MLFFIASKAISGLMVMSLATPSLPAETYTTQEVEFIQWYEADAANAAYFDWVIFMQDPANAAWFEWKTNPPVVVTASTPYGVWDRLAECESHGEWNYGPHSTWGSKLFHGGLQFHPGTWSAYKLPGYPTYAYQASREQQIKVGERVLAAQGWGAWPDCSRKLGLR